MTATTVPPTPGQLRVSDTVLSPDAPRPEYAAEVARALRDAIETPLARVAESYDTRSPLRLAKGRLADVHRCEGLAVARRGAPFVHSYALVRGTLTHAAIERAIIGRSPGGASPDAAALAREVLGRAMQVDRDRALAEWLGELPDSDRDDLIREVTGAVTDFCIQWPAIGREWAPRAESTVSASLCDGRIRLAGRYDLALGTPRGRHAGTIIIDFKTGDMRQSHLNELRFYAVVETLRSGVPPYRLAVYSLDAATAYVEDVTETLLADAACWLVEHATALHEVFEEERDPDLHPGPTCNWCPARDTCLESTAGG